MQTVLIVIHLMIVVALVGVVLLQRSEGGALGMGGGTMGGMMTARGSANLLTRKPEAAAEVSAESPPSSPRPEPLAPTRPTSARTPMSLASVRFAESTLKSVVKDINLTEVRVIAKRDQVFPGILDQAVVDIEIAEGQMARLNGYVHQLQAVDKRQDTDFVSVTIRFVDEDPKKLEDLSRFVARFRAGMR